MVSELCMWACSITHAHTYTTLAQRTCSSAAGGDVGAAQLTAPPAPGDSPAVCGGSIPAAELRSMTVSSWLLRPIQRRSRVSALVAKLAV